MKVNNAAQENKVLLIPNLCIPVTLLVPPALHTVLYDRMEEMGMCLSEYFEYLLKKANNQYNQLPVSNQFTTKYQKRGTYPTRFDMRISNYLWAELKLLSRSHGYSACQMFIFLLIMDNDNCNAVNKAMSHRYAYFLYSEIINLDSNSIVKHIGFGDTLDRRPIGIQHIQTCTIRSS